MGWTLGGETGRGKKAKGWILYRLEDEIEEADGDYAAALMAEHKRLKSKSALEFAQHTKRSELVQALWKAQRQAGLVTDGDELSPPLAQAVRDAVDG